MFHGVSFRLLHNPPLDQITALFGRLRQDGADAIAIIPHHYVSLQPGTANLTAPPAGWQPPWFIYPDLGQDPDHPFHNTPEPELVLAACKAAAGMGFQVLLKPHVDSYQATWRGDISVAARTADWAWGYRNRFLQRYLDIANQVPGTILCLGCELYTVTKELGADFWIGVADWVRGQGFKGPLTYAANWGGWADDAEYKRLKDLWPHLDYLGVDAYFPLVPQGYSGPLDLGTLVAAWHRKGVDAAWCPNIDDDLLAFSKAVGKPLLFTEIGYGNHTLAAQDPMRDPLPSDVRDDNLQLTLAQAFRQRWGAESAFQGYFWWEAFLDQANKLPISHDIIDRPVEAVIFKPLPGEPGTSGGGGIPVPAPPPQPPPQPPPPGPAPADVLAIHGIHGPNLSFASFTSQPGGPPVGAGAAWNLITASRAKWIKLLQEDHQPADAQAARGRGLKVIVRVKGEGIVHWEDALAVITLYRGVADVVEIGNEPFPGGAYPTWETLLWNHAAFMDQVWQHCAQPAHDAGMILCTGGWQGEREPLLAGSVIHGGPGDYTIKPDLAARLSQVYGQYDAIGVHCYSPDVLAIDPQIARIDRWHKAYNKPIYITEYGIAGRFLRDEHLQPVPKDQSDNVKAQRYADFLRRLAGLGYVKTACIFILNGTPDYAAFTGGGFDPNGINSYWLNNAAWSTLGTAAAAAPRDLAAAAGRALAGVRDVRALGGEEIRDFGGGLARDLAPALTISDRDLGTPPRHIGWNDRPHGPDYPFESVPTISPTVFATVLVNHRSPALQQADAIDYYNLAMGKGLNPAVALAFFEHESTCGTDGPVAAAGANNWGNLRPGSGGNLGRAVRLVNTQFGAFRSYNNYKDSLLDWCDLLLSPLYRGKSIRDALKIYAPASDQNSPTSYASIVLSRIALWDQQSGDFDIPGSGTIFTTQVTDYPLLANPSIPVSVFTQALVAANSPVLQEADGSAYFQICVANGVDPTVALAFFQLESNCGTAPGVAALKNWGNLWDASTQTFETYPSWLQGLRDWCTRLQGPAYTRFGPPTIKSIVPIYQPALARKNGNDWYIGQLSLRIGNLISAPRDLAPAARILTPNAGNLAPASRDLGLAGGDLAPAEAPAPPPAPADHPVAGPPTLSPAVFAGVLQERQSPALAEAPAADYYQACVDAGIDPGVAVAVFEHESGCGANVDTAVVPLTAKNWANLRAKTRGANGRASHVVTTPAGTFRAYDSWLEGLRDWCDLMNAAPYAGKSVGAMLAVFAPGADQDDPNSYANTVLRRMAEWIAASGDFAAPSPAAVRDLGVAGGAVRDLGSPTQPKWVGASDANYAKGRAGHTPIAVVNHEMQGTLTGTQQAFWNPQHQASAHYGVGRDGTVVQFVNEQDTAWANGPIRNPNLAAVPWIADVQANHGDPNTLSVTIEWEGQHDGDWGSVTWNGATFPTITQGSVRSWFTPTDAQYQAGLALIRAIAARWKITLDRAHICRHSDFDSVTKWFCPGQEFPMQRILNDLVPPPAPPVPTPPPAPAPGIGYSLLAAPTIPIDTFTQALAAVNSPALQEADGTAYYQMCVANNVDPAVALAFFQQESNCGTVAGAADHKNWGNLWDAQANAVATYPSWQEGLRDWCIRLQGPAYLAHGTPTVASIVPIYQPAGARENGNDTYIAQVTARIDSLRGSARDLGPA